MSQPCSPTPLPAAALPAWHAPRLEPLGGIEHETANTPSINVGDGVTPGS